MALALYNSLQGEAEQELEHTPIEDIHCPDGVDKILALLKGPMEQKVVYTRNVDSSTSSRTSDDMLERYAGLCESLSTNTAVSAFCWHRCVSDL